MLPHPIARILTGLALASLTTIAFAQDATLRVGDQRGNARAVMEAAGVLKDVPYKIEWREFPNAAPLLEALSSGAIDAGSVGDAPLTFAAASGVKAKAIFATRYDGNAIIVKDGSPIQSLADLKGKKVALVKGSSGHNLFLQALTRAGLPVDSVQYAFLPPAEATLALQNGSVDAVSTWEPYVSFATQKSGARILVDGKEYPALSYFIASNSAIDSKPEQLRDFVARNAKARAWGLEHPKEYATIIAEIVNIPEDVAFSKQTRENHAPEPITDRIAQLQQATIDLYRQSGLIDADLKASDLLDTRFSPAP